MMNKGVCIRLLLLLMILFALGYQNEACCRRCRQRRRRRRSPDTTPPKYVDEEFAACNRKSSTKNYGKFVVVKPKGKFWNTPKAKDEESRPVHVGEPYLPQEFGTGVHEFAYYAWDSAPSPNINICKIRFEVQVKTCPVLSYPVNGFHDCPRTTMTTDYLVVGTTCRYFCKDGYNLRGAPQLKCKETSTGRTVKVAWVPLPEPTCTLMTCGQLEDPSYGTVSCTRQDEYSSICSYKCDEGYDLGPGVASNLICLSSGWSAPPVLECTETIPPVSSNAHADLIYPAATCASRAEEENIRQSAGSNILNNIRASGCKNCAVSNLKVKNCGLSRKRSVVTSPITVSVVMDLNNITEDESLVEFGSNLEQRLQNGSFAMEVGGQVIEADVNRSGGQAVITCPFGTGLTLEGRCVVCPAGTYYYVLPNTTEAVCGYCPLHTYQDQDGQDNCIPCPSGLITNDPGADDIHFCIEPCPVGHYQDVWADSNETVCIQCPYDSYQNETGKESCVPCPDKYVTLEQGSTSSSDCVALCNAGHYVDLSNETNPQCPPCPLNTFMDLDLHQEQECSPCPQGLITTQNGSSQSTDCLVVCEPGTYLESSTCIPCPLNTYQDQINHRESSCINCTGDLVTFHEGSENQQDCEEEPDETEVSKGRHVAIISGSLASVIVVIFLVVTAVYCVKKMQHRMKVGDESVEMEKVEAARAVRMNNYTAGMSE